MLTTDHFKQKMLSIHHFYPVRHLYRFYWCMNSWVMAKSKLFGLDLWPPNAIKFILMNQTNQSVNESEHWCKIWRNFRFKAFLNIWFETIMLDTKSKETEIGDMICSLIKTGLRHSGNEGCLSDHLSHPPQGLSSSTAQDGIRVVQSSHHQGQSWFTHLLRPKSALILSQTLQLKRKRNIISHCSYYLNDLPI